MRSRALVVRQPGRMPLWLPLPLLVLLPNLRYKCYYSGLLLIHVPFRIGLCLTISSSSGKGWSTSPACFECFTALSRSLRFLQFGFKQQHIANMSAATTTKLNMEEVGIPTPNIICFLLAWLYRFLKFLRSFNWEIGIGLLIVSIDLRRARISFKSTLLWFGARV